MSTFDTDYTALMVCPWCGYADEDSWEFDDTEDGTTECGNCGEEFDYAVLHETHYSTRKNTNHD